MEKQKRQVNPEALLMGARENDYSSLAPTRLKDIQNDVSTDSPKSEDREPAVQPAVSGTPKPVASEEQPKPTPVEKSRKERGRRLSHKELFVKNTSLKARKGIQAYIRPEFHEQIQRIVDVVGKKEISRRSSILPWMPTL